MAKTGARDIYSNMATIEVTESAANTLTFKKLETGISLFEKLAWVIHRIEYWIDQTATIFNTNEDYILVALTSSDQITSITAKNAAVIDEAWITRVDIGTAATAHFIVRPFIRDFSTLPGQGLIIPPNPLYLCAKGTGLASATTSYCRIYYTTHELSADEYWELVESRRLISST